MPKRKHNANSRKPPFEYVIWFFTVATPLFEIPQAIDIYSHHSAQDVSVLTWGFFLLDNLVWIVYGVRKRLRPVVITSILYLIIELSVVVGIIMYS
ncbi:MAG TPA: hypothetical protein VMB52_04260 [Verrucomicrobiae bacterium]|nr:hypothetical protein [Verrucomicrobiae bacterium]